MQAFTLFLAFILEVGAILAIGYAGFHYDLPTIFQIILGIGLPVLFILFWGLYMAPKATKRLELKSYRIVKLGLFIGAGGMLLSVNEPIWAISFLILVAVDELLLLVLFKGRTS